MSLILTLEQKIKATEELTGYRQAYKDEEWNDLFGGYDETHLVFVENIDTIKDELYYFEITDKSIKFSLVFEMPYKWVKLFEIWGGKNGKT